MGECEVHFRLLGSVSVKIGEREFCAFRTRKTAALLAYLALHPGRPQPREVLLDLLWPESDYEAGRNSLRVALSSLRQIEELPLVAERDTVWLQAERVITDAEVFRRAARQALNAESPDLLSKLQQARALYTGPLLEGFEGEWIADERNDLSELYGSVLRKLSRTLARAERFTEALEVARLAAEATPYHEGAHRTLIRLLARMGEGYEAREVYRTLVKRLQEDLRATPSKETLELWAQLRAPAPEQPPKLDLPQNLTRFFGREAEIAELESLLNQAEIRLVTLTGVGGSGKTRLALQVLAGRSEAKGFASCANLRISDSLPKTVASALGIRAEDARNPIDAIAARIDHQPFLLALDNMEGVLGTNEASAWLVRLLERIPTLKILATSRRPIEAPGEVRFPVGPLPTPLSPSEDALLACPSVLLFLDRAQRRRPSFRLTAESAEPVWRLCQRLDGMPLAIELAATWVNALSLPEMCAEVCRRLDIFSTSDASFEERHRSLRQVIQASYEMLPPSAQSLFRCVSLLAGGFSRDLATAVSPNTDSWQVTQDLALLGERALVVESESNGDSYRFRVLEPLREFGREVCPPMERDEALAGAADFLTRLVHRANGELEGERSAESLEAIELEHANIGSVLDWCEVEDIPRGLQLMGSLARPWEVLTHLAEGHARCHRLLAGVSEEHDSVTVARVHYCAALMCHGLGDPTATENHLNQAERRLREGEEWSLVCHILRRRIELMGFWGRKDEANELAEECIRIAEAHCEMRHLAHGLGVRGDILRDYGKHEEACEQYAKALEILEREGDLLGMCTMTASFGYHLSEGNRLSEAHALLERSLELARRLHYRAGIAHRYWLLGNVAWKGGRVHEAGDLYAESLEMHRRDGDRRGMVYAMGNLAVVRMVQGQVEDAASLLHERLQLVEAMGDFGGVAQTLVFLARTYWRSGALDLAARTYRRAVEYSRTHALPDRILEMLPELTLLHLSKEEDERARECLREISVLRGERENLGSLFTFANAVMDSRSGQPEHLRRLMVQPESLPISQEFLWMVEPFGFGTSLCYTSASAM